MFVHSYTITDTIILIHVDHVSTINVHHIFWPIYLNIQLNTSSKESEFSKSLLIY